MTAPPPLSTADVRVFLEVAAGAVQSTPARAKTLHRINQVAPDLLQLGHAIGEYRLSKSGEFIATHLRQPKRTPIGFEGDRFLFFPADNVLVNTTALRRTQSCRSCGAQWGSPCVRITGAHEGQPIVSRTHGCRNSWGRTVTPSTESQIRRASWTEQPGAEEWTWCKVQRLLKAIRRSIQRFGPLPEKAQPLVVLQDDLHRPFKRLLVSPEGV